jgi:choline dehydrogenase-like flavoprotein
MSAASTEVGGSREDRIRRLVDAILPAGELPSASGAGVPDVLTAVTAQERPDWAARVDAILDRFDAVGAEALLEAVGTDPELGWFCTLVGQAYVADPGNGGNRDRDTWRHLGWSPDPPGGWPADANPSAAVGDPSLAVVAFENLRPRYDVVIVGSGPGGSVAAAKLTATGRSVLVVEWGTQPDRSTLARDHLRSPRVITTLDPLTTAPSPLNPRTLGVGGPPVPSWDARWGSNANTVGGGSRVYGAQAWRFVPTDFTMASSYGRPAGSALADWPIGYEDLEPFYTEAEWALGVSGSGSDGLPRSRPYPMTPLPMTGAGRVLTAGAERLGLGLVRVPLAINHGAYHGRPGCAGCRQCVGFSCPIGAKNDAVNGFLEPAARTGNLQLVSGTRALRITTDGSGRVRGVLLCPAAGGTPVEIAARDVVVAAGAVESARLLLNSPSAREPSGLGNGRDQVGRHLQGHVYGGALGLFDDPVDDGRGPGPVVSTHDFRHHNDALVGGGMIANEFAPTPLEALGYLTGAGLLPRHGAEVMPMLRDLMPRMQRVVGPVQEVTSAESRVSVDPAVTDSLGVPVARLSGGLHANDLAAQRLLSERAADWLRASGARQVVTAAAPAADRPSSGQHQAGSCRMGTDPAGSVTDPAGRVWGHDNLRVIDGSTHVTNGGVNPMLTIFANSLRVLAAWVADDPR